MTYADIPLPFGEMHTENISSLDLIRAAIVAQLAKPAAMPSTYSQITNTFKFQILTWIGIVGSAITLFANLKGVLDLADWASELVAHWHEWTQPIWAWVFSLIGVKMPKYIASIISFIFFTTILVVGVNLSARRVNASVKSQHAPAMKRVGILIAGVIAVLVGLYAVGRIMVFASLQWGWIILDEDNVPTDTALVIGWLWLIVFPVGYLMCFVKERPWVLISSLLFLCMVFFLLNVPLWNLPQGEFLIGGVSLVALETGWMAVILFSPLRQLTRRLGFVVLGVITLVVLSEISKLNLHQYLQPPKASEISSPTHNLPSHAA